MSEIKRVNRVHLGLNETTTVADLEEFLAITKDTFGEDSSVRVGAQSSDTGVFLVSTDEV